MNKEIIITNSAAQQIRNLLNNEYEKKSYFRIKVEGGGCAGFQYNFVFTQNKELDDELFTKNLYKKHGVIVLPGSYLGGKNKYPNPGKNFVRIAIVHDNKTIEIAVRAINEMLNE